MNSDPSVSWEKAETQGPEMTQWEVELNRNPSSQSQKMPLHWAEHVIHVCVCVCVLFFCHTLSSRSQASWKRRQVPQEKSVTFSGQQARSPWDTPLPSLGPVRWLTALSLPEYYHAEFSASCGPVCSPLSYFITCRAGAVGVTWSLAVQNGFRPFSGIEGKCDTPLGIRLEKAFST